MNSVNFVILIFLFLFSQCDAYNKIWYYVVTVVGHTTFYRESLAFPNLATNGTAIQDSHWTDGHRIWTADLAIDGNTNQNFGANSCCHTQSRTGETWWRLDLGQPANINRIVLYYKSATTTVRMNGFYLYISDTFDQTKPNSGVLCYHDPRDDNYPSNVQNRTCDTVGRYIIYYNDYSILELCEVLVLGCYFGRYGSDCEHNCPQNCSGTCNLFSGVCSSCKPGYKGDICNETCSLGEYGENCLLTCFNCENNDCFPDDGVCKDGCKTGWKGEKCETECDPGMYGPNCTVKCGSCLSGTCDRFNGSCVPPGVCVVGMVGEKCDKEKAKILFSDAKNIGIFHVEDGTATIIYTLGGWIMHVDYHYPKGYVYWTDEWHGVFRLKYPFVNDTESAEKIQGGNNTVGIAVDTINDKVYWTNQRENKLYRSELDGSDKIVIFDSLVDFERDIALDFVNGWMFFSHGRLEKCRFDGSERQTVIDYASVFQSLEIDFAEERIYWTDQNLQQIRSAFFDGSDIQAVPNLTPTTSFYGLALTPNFLYYSLWPSPTGALYSIARKEPSSAPVKLYDSLNGTFKSIKVYTKEDSCYRHKIIQNQFQRSVGNVIDISVDIPISDKALDERWYRIKGDTGDRMPTSPPGELNCGSLNPIWLNDSYPDVGFSNSKKVCIQTSNDTCEEEFNIDIKNCGTYYVYYLKNTTEDSSYCFGTISRCPPGFSSETLYFPGCGSMIALHSSHLSLSFF